MKIELAYDSKYRKENTKYIAVHHFGSSDAAPYAPMAGFTLNYLEELHRQRFGDDFTSQIVNPKTGRGYHVGYNGVIFPDHFVQTRAIGEETAAQIGHNFNGEAVSFCLAGNFTKKPDGTLAEKPTAFQIQTLYELAELFPQVNLWNIVPHRNLSAKPTACYGTGLADDWARTLIALNRRISLLTILASLYAKLLDLRRQQKFAGMKVPSLSCIDDALRDEQ